MSTHDQQKPTTQEYLTKFTQEVILPGVETIVKRKLHTFIKEILKSIISFRKT